MTAAAWVFRPVLARVGVDLSDAGIAIGGALLLFLVPVRWDRFERALDWSDTDRLPWGVLVLFGGGLSLASAIQATGLAGWIGGALASFTTWPPLGVVLLVTTVVVFLTEMTSNTATAAALLPVAASLALAMGVEPLLLATATALAASCAFMMPVATPPNAIVYGSGLVTVPQMVRAGVVVNLILIGLITATVLVLVPRVLGGG
jgi:sodium-dependent dicarboxylate transporter 2/3/5